MSAGLWQADEAATATKGRATGAWSASGVSIDSRSAGPGDLFVALHGPNFDGHDFVAGALQAGCAAAVVDRHPDGIGDDAPLLEVEDTFAALNALGAAARTRSEARIVAITGSVGKTGVKEALTSVLSAQGTTHATSGNLNNHWGVPLTLSRMPRDAAYGVIEIGMNQPGEITPLSQLVRPHVGVITTVEAVHLEFFDSVAHIAEAKAEIFAGLASGTAILNRDNPFFPLLAVTAMAADVDRVIGFGAHPEAEARLLAYETGRMHNKVRAVIDGKDIDYALALPGRHWAINSLAVLAAAGALGAVVVKAAETLALVTPAKGRGTSHEIRAGARTFLLIDDSYNASPASVRAALETLAATEPQGEGRRIAALGDMLELGADSAHLHESLAAVAAAQGIDLVYAAGPMMAHLHEALPVRNRGACAEDSAALAESLASDVKDGDVILVKGSLGSRMAVVVDALLGLNDEPAQAVNGN